MGIGASERLTRGVSARVGVGIGVAVGAVSGLAVAARWVARTDVDRECAACPWPVGDVAQAPQGASTAIRAAPRAMAEASASRLPKRGVMPTPYAPGLAGR